MAAPDRTLRANQALAVKPADSVWLSASAGTGKTHVLTSRVLRLLLEPGVRPESVLCLTFTKAGAAEMVTRIGQILARWVRIDPTGLGRELLAIGAEDDPATRERARTLFAAVLDCPGGGLRIDTIHAFAQWLLAAFPSEAGLSAGTRPIEERERTLLARSVLADLLVEAAGQGDKAPVEALAALTLRWGEGEVERFLLRCAGAHDLWLGPASWAPPLAPHVHRLLGLPADFDAAALADLCADDAFPTDAVQLMQAAYAAWGTKTGLEGHAAIAEWLAQSPAARLAGFDGIAKLLFTKEELPRSEKSLVKFEAHFADAAAEVLAAVQVVRARRQLLELATRLAPALELGRRFALAWNAAKAREGLIDFDDQIRAAAALLQRSEMSAWIRYKLDRRFDHVLVDEAQDTNAAQWRIIKALTDDFFAGEGQRGGASRTLFVVGDYKQAIFGFQGTSPENFSAAGDWFDAAIGLTNPRGLQRLGLGESFRSAASLLGFVDRAIRHIGHSEFGLSLPPDPHIGRDLPGHVALWQPVGTRPAGDGDTAAAEQAADPDEDAEASPEQGWVTRSDRVLAQKIARQVKDWLDDGFALHKGGLRRATAGDIMVLVRKRRELAGLIVAQLHAHGVPVAGVDRLRLGAPLAVKDLIVALRFAAQPFDDLSLAALLVSPLVGWSQEQLLEYGWREHGALWSHLRALREPFVAATLDQLGDLLRRADHEPVQGLLHWLLVGPWQARKRLVARLGREAGDPIDELVNAAYAYAATGTPSIVGFLQWFDAGEGELKREADSANGLVRVLTVHGSKGLEAPIVILADATGSPESTRAVALDLADPASLIDPDAEPRRVPLPGLKADERVGRIAEAAEAEARAALREHWRLLYVAMTRAEEALFVTGALAAREEEPGPNSWYTRLAGLFDPADALEDPLWGSRLETGPRAVPPPAPRAEPELPIVGEPGWMRRPAGEEPRPPRPLAPSALGEDLGPEPPAPASAAAAARRGTLIHRLLERLPGCPPDQRADLGARWLARQAAELEPGQRAEILAAALTTIADPRWADLFTTAALAEVPIAATVAGEVIAGTIDRLLVTPSELWLVDFKTTRRPPANAAQVSPAHLRQMAAYAAALEVAYPERAIRVALLYTHAPRLIELDAAQLALHKPGFAAGQQSFDV
jgi:ATP-dependent helicase/nuclease subunit A